MPSTLEPALRQDSGERGIWEKSPGHDCPSAAWHLLSPSSRSWPTAFSLLSPGRDSELLVLELGDGGST